MEPRGNSKTAVEARRNAWVGRLKTELTRMVGVLSHCSSVRRVILDLWPPAKPAAEVISTW